MGFVLETKLRYWPKHIASSADVVIVLHTLLRKYANRGLILRRRLRRGVKEGGLHLLCKQSGHENKTLKAIEGSLNNSLVFWFAVRFWIFGGWWFLSLFAFCQLEHTGIIHLNFDHSEYLKTQYIWVIKPAWDQDGWILAKFFFYVFMDRDGIEVHIFSSCHVFTYYNKNFFQTKHVICRPREVYMGKKLCLRSWEQF